MARQDIEVRVVDKTSAALNGIQRKLGQVEKNTRNLERGFDNVLGKVVAIGAALGAGFGLKRIIEVSSQVEQLNLRFAFLFRSVDEGSKAFETMLNYASTVPFTLEQIAAGSANLAVASRNAEEFAANLGIAGNVAAVFGLDFQQTSEQIQRAFSSGIASADIFRERGVAAFLGFQAGATYSIEETRKKFEETFGPGGPLQNATLILANTYEGIFSMIQDKYFKFTLALGKEGGIFDFVKAGLKALDTIVERNFGTLENFAKVAGEKFIQFVKESIIGAARIIDAVMPIFKFVASGIAGLINMIDMLPEGVKQLGIIGFLLLGTKGKLIAITIGAVFDVVRAGIGYILDGLGALYGGLAWVFNKLGLLSEEKFGIAKETQQELYDWAESLKTPMSELNKEAQATGETIGGPVQQAAEDFLAELYKQDEALKTEAETVKEVLKGLEGTGEQIDQNTAKFNEITASLEYQNSLIGKTREEQEIMNALKSAEAKLGGQLTDAQTEQITNLIKYRQSQEKLNSSVEDEIKLRKEAALEALKSGRKFAAEALGFYSTQQLQKDLNVALQTINDDYRNGEIDSEAQMLQLKEELNIEYQRRLDQLAETSLRKRIQNAMIAEKELVTFKLKNSDIETLQRIGKENRIQQIVNDRIEFEKKSELEKTQFGLEQGVQLFEGLSKVNKKFFAAQKAAAIALAIVNTYQGATKALATYPPPFNFIAAAATVASGLAQVATIRAQTMQRGGALPQGQAAIVGEDGAELIVPKQPSTVIPREVADAIDGLGGRGGDPVVVNFNITTVDAESFDTLLIRRRGTITSIINGALQKRGKEGVV